MKILEFIIKHKDNNQKGKSNIFFLPRYKGFTLLELLVSLSVMTVISTTLIYRYPETSVRLNLANNNQTIALALREAQIRGSAVDSVNNSLGGYGVYFDASTPRRVILFGDTVDASAGTSNGLPIGDGLYSATTPFNEAQTVTIFATSSTSFISKICVGTSYPFSCGANNTPQVTSLTISFTRPSPLPSIYLNNTTTRVMGACIEMRSNKAIQNGILVAGHVRSVQVFSSGMIRSSATGCDAQL